MLALLHKIQVLLRSLALTAVLELQHVLPSPWQAVIAYELRILSRPFHTKAFQALITCKLIVLSQTNKLECCFGDRISLCGPSSPRTCCVDQGSSGPYWSRVLGWQMVLLCFVVSPKQPFCPQALGVEPRDLQHARPGVYHGVRSVATALHYPLVSLTGRALH